MPCTNSEQAGVTPTLGKTKLEVEEDSGKFDTGVSTSLLRTITKLFTPTYLTSARRFYFDPDYVFCLLGKQYFRDSTIALFASFINFLNLVLRSK